MKPTPALLVVLLCSLNAHAVDTLPAGQGQPVPTGQPAVGLVLTVASQGVFPSSSGGSSSMTMAMVRPFGGTFNPFGEPLLDGRLVSISMNSALFSLLGTMYGGNGQTTFAVPDARDAFLASTNATFPQGTRFGVTTQTLTTAELAAHTHAIGADQTGSTGLGMSISPFAPTLSLKFLICVNGVFPSMSGGNMMPFIGQVVPFAGNFAPSGWLAAEGQLLPIAQYQALFAVIGTTYGGNGTSTFALPDLRVRIPVGTGTSPTRGPVAPGMTWGNTQVNLTTARLPAHAHALVDGGVTDMTGSSQAFDWAQPSLGLTHLVALQGVYPSRDTGGWPSDTPVLGEVVLFAGNFAPGGFALAQGQLLSIAQNSALFSLLGTTFGGNGTMNFALPDLRGRSLLGTSGTNPVGSLRGQDSLTLTLGTLPTHVHSTPDFDAGVDDAGVDDAGVDDAGVDDAGVDDAGVDDAGADDAGVDDAGVMDAGADDAGAMDDAGTMDAGADDAGAMDDAGVTDAGAADAGAMADAGNDGDAGMTDAGAGDAGMTATDGGMGGEPAVGCSCSSEPSGAWFVWLALAALLWRRRTAA